jgi:hypothetical protein
MEKKNVNIKRQYFLLSSSWVRTSDQKRACLWAKRIVIQRLGCSKTNLSLTSVVTHPHSLRPPMSLMVGTVTVQRFPCSAFW